MISICTTVYFEKENLEIFIRSLAGNASDNDWELVIVNGANSTTETLDKFKHLPIKVINYSREERVNFVKKMVQYYKKHKIFSKKHLDEMWQTYKDYESGKIERLWLPTPQKFNMAAKKAKGDILIFMPADYLVFFDVSSLYAKCKEILADKGLVYGHFDWVDLNVIDPDEILHGLRKCKTHKEFREFTHNYLFKGGHPVAAQHGARVVDRELFDRIGGFDERWFTRALGEDLFNDACRREWGTPYQLIAYDEFAIDSLFVGNLRPNEAKNYNYLTPSYSISMEDHLYFADKIKEWIGGGGQ